MLYVRKEALNYSGNHNDENKVRRSLWTRIV